MTAESFFAIPAIVVLCTTANAEEAASIGQVLVEERLAACVNILPPIQSIYRWKERIERDTEILLVIKTTPERFAALRERILALHSYDTPEVIALPVSAGSDKYLAWLREQVD